LSSISEEADQLLKELTQPHQRMGHLVPSLLGQLKAEIMATNTTGGSSQMGSRLPFGVQAYDLYELITADAAALWVGAPRLPNSQGREQGIWGRFGAWDAQINKPLPTGLTEDAVNAFAVKKWRYAHQSPTEDINAWVRSLATDFQAQVAEKIITRWHQRVSGLLEPTSRPEYLGPCPKCGSRYSFDSNSGIRSAALVIAFPGGTAQSRCGVCDARWFGGRAVAQMAFDSDLRAAVALGDIRAK
jgi:hypothetical protein